MNIFGKNRNVSRGSGWMAARGLSDGAQAVVPWVQALIIEGYGFTTGFGRRQRGHRPGFLLVRCGRL